MPMRVELVRQLRRRRTQVAFALVAALPVILWIAFALAATTGRPGRRRTSSTSPRAAAANFAVFALFASAAFLLVVVVALFFGDTVASEASWSSLRYLLAAPIPRARLLRQKAIVAGLLSLAALAAAAGGRAAGRRRSPTAPDDLVSPTGESLPFGAGCRRMLLGALYLAVHLSWVAGLALLLSVCTDAPLGAVGGAVMASIVSQILDQITALGRTCATTCPPTTARVGRAARRPSRLGRHDPGRVLRRLLRDGVRRRRRLAVHAARTSRADGGAGHRVGTTAAVGGAVAGAPERCSCAHDGDTV